MTQKVVIGSNTVDVSADVKRIEVWDEASAGVGRFEILLRNASGTYNGVFSAHEAVDIDISSADIMNGWVDAIHKEVSDEPDIFTQDLRIFGRNYGRELLDLTVDKYYAYQPADDIVDDLLSTASSNITYTTANAGASLSFDSKNAYLLNSIQKLAERDDADFYVDTASALQYFSIGANSSGITLAAVAGSETSNNILDFEWDEAEGTDIKNYIIVRGKQVNDGWTEFNQADFTVPTNGSAGSETTIYNAGVASIKFTKSTATASWLELDFSGTLYGRSSLDWSGVKSGELSFAVYTGSIPASVYIQLTDTGGNVIKYIFGARWLSHLMAANKWRSFSTPIGIDNDPEFVTLGSPSNKWIEISGSNFTWVIEKIRIGVTAAMDFYLDGLKLPNLMISLAQDATSQSNYGTRHLVVDRFDIESQVELDAEGVDILAKRKDPIKTLNVIAKGSSGIVGGANKWLPGYTVTVNIPGEGISNQTYRMMSVHQIYDEDNPYKGFAHRVILVLTVSTTKIDLNRWRALKDDAALLRELREALAVLQQEEEGDIDRYPALPSPIADLYLFSSQQWTEFWEADKAPITIKTGTSTVSDANATENIAIVRSTTDASADMWDSADIWPPGGSDGTGGTFYFHFRMKVANNASSATIVQLAVYNVTGAANLATLDVSPDMFTAANTYEFISMRVSVNPGYPIKIRGDSFVTSITDLYLDWVGISAFPVPFASQSTGISAHTGTAVDAHSGTDTDSHSGTDTDAHSGTDTDAHGGTDTDAHSGAANVATGNHVHSVTYRQGYLVIGWTTRYCASASGGPVTTAFSAPSSSYLDNYVYGTAVSSGGSHNHTQGQASNHSVTQPSNHSVTQPSNHSVTDPDNHSVTDPDNHSVTQPNAHSVTNPNHVH